MACFEEFMPIKILKFPKYMMTMKIWLEIPPLDRTSNIYFMIDLKKKMKEFYKIDDKEFI